MNKQEVVALMKNSRSEEEWKVNLELVKKAYGGLYPPFWYNEIVRPGLANTIAGDFDRIETKFTVLR